MDAALIKLLLLRLRGGLRYRLSELRTMRGVLFLCVTTGVILLLLSRSSLLSGDLGLEVLAGDPALAARSPVAD